ncbi:hypothetical protein PIROE2DRAFT_5316 [Piromyces sp. E2]|nr:hypothetical protein PIROE2DRAFT_5316 [Piromyces sp. E2]|eukprot:OUM67258.1 hypothetical protein PIROE2DRAFT_5316 [Piromyces sp. E2]
MKYYKLLINLFISLCIVTWVKAQDETTTEKPEIILTPGPKTGEYKKKDLDTSYDDSSINIQCSGTSCIASSDVVLINEGNVTISTAGTYVFQGELTGQVYISATKDDYIHLVLNNMAISSEFGPAIYDVLCDKLVITSIGENSLIDSTNYPVDETEEDEEEDEDKDESNEQNQNSGKTEQQTEEDATKKKSPNACLFAKSDLTFNGEGSISITGNYYEGIRCKKDLKFVSGAINVKAVEKGIKAKNSISIKEATINVDAVDSGIKVTKDTDPEKGFIVIDGGKISVISGNDGIHAETHLSINGGYIDVSESKEGLEGQMIDIVGGEIHVNANDDGINASKIGNYYEGIRCKKDLKFVSGAINVKAVEKGIKAKNSISIKEATINVDAVDSGIKVTKDTDPEKGFIVIDGGKISVKSGNDGIHAETHLSINGGYIDVSESKEGLEGQMIDIVGGEIHVNANDDGINASKIGQTIEESELLPGGFPGGSPGDIPAEGFSGEFPDNLNDKEKSNQNNTIDNNSFETKNLQESENTLSPTINNNNINDNKKSSKSKKCFVIKKSNKSKVHITKTTFLTTTKTSLQTSIPKIDSDIDSNSNSSSSNSNSNFNCDIPKNYENDEKVYIRITGGKVYVKINGNDADGIDSNGSLYIGGDATVFVSNDPGDIYGNISALDAEGSNVIDKGASVVVTASKIAPPPPDDNFPGMGGPGGPVGPGGPDGFNGPNGPGDMEGLGGPGGPGGPNGPNGPGGMEGLGGPCGGSSEKGTVKQANIHIIVDLQEAGSDIIVKDSDGKIIITHQPENMFSEILISTPKLVEGATYTVVAGNVTTTSTATISE